MFRKKDPEEVREHTKHNREEVLSSQTCGCLGCLATFGPTEIEEWTDEVDRDNPEAPVDWTAICPHCGEAMVLGDRSGHEVTAAFLEAMRMR